MADRRPAVTPLAEEQAAPAPRDAPRSLRAKIMGGLRWKAVSTVSVQVTRAVVAIVLARLLTPDDFGLAAVVLVFSGLAFIFTDLGLGAALVQRPEIGERDRSTVFWTSAGAGALLAVAGVAASWPIAAFYGRDEVQPLLAVFSITFLLAGLTVTQAALLTREMRFRSLELRIVTATLVGGAVGIALAVLGYGAWAIVAQAMAGTAISVALLWVVSPWRPHLTFSRRSLRDLGGFGAKVFGTRVLWDLNKNTDNVLIGRFLGASSLGAYAIAYNLMLFPLSRIAGPIRSVMLPAFSSVQSDTGRLTEGWLRANRAVAAAAMPAMLGMAVVAPDFVPVVLGEQWREAVPVLQILAVVGLLQSLMQIGGTVLYARDRSGQVLAFVIGTYALNVVAFVAGLPWGIVGVATAYAIATALTVPAFTWLTARALGSTVRSYARAVRGPTEAALAMAAGLVTARVAIIELGVSAGPRLLALVVLGAAIYLPLCAWRAPELRAELRRRSGPATAPGG